MSMLSYFIKSIIIDCMNLCTCMFQYNFERVNNCLNEVNVRPCEFHLNVATRCVCMLYKCFCMYVYTKIKRLGGGDVVQSGREIFINEL